MNSAGLTTDAMAILSSSCLFAHAAFSNSALKVFTKTGVAISMSNLKAIVRERHESCWQFRGRLSSNTHWQCTHLSSSESGSLSNALLIMFNLSCSLAVAALHFFITVLWAELEVDHWSHAHKEALRRGSTQSCCCLLFPCAADITYQHRHEGSQRRSKPRKGQKRLPKNAECCCTSCLCLGWEIVMERFEKFGTNGVSIYEMLSPRWGEFELYVNNTCRFPTRARTRLCIFFF